MKLGARTFTVCLILFQEYTLFYLSQNFKRFSWSYLLILLFGCQFFILQM